MKYRTRPGTAVALVLASHPLQALAITAAVAVAATLAGRPGREVGLVAATVLAGRLTVGWVNDVADRSRDRRAGREDKPIALGWIHPSTVNFTTACTTCLVVPLSVANGVEAGVAHLGSVAAGWLYSFKIKATWLSWLPWAVSFGLLPAFLSYGGWGGGSHGSPPTLTITLLAALLGVGAHFLDALPDLVEDNNNGMRHLPLRIALRIGAPRLLWLSAVFTMLVAAGIVVTGLTVGLAAPPG